MARRDLGEDDFQSLRRQILCGPYRSIAIFDSPYGQPPETLAVNTGNNAWRHGKHITRAEPRHFIRVITAEQSHHALAVECAICKRPLLRRSPCKCELPNHDHCTLRTLHIKVEATTSGLSVPHLRVLTPKDRTALSLDPWYEVCTKCFSHTAMEVVTVHGIIKDAETPAMMTFVTCKGTQLLTLPCRQARELQLIKAQVLAEFFQLQPNEGVEIRYRFNDQGMPQTREWFNRHCPGKEFLQWALAGQRTAVLDLRVEQRTVTYDAWQEILRPYCQEPLEVHLWPRTEDLHTYVLLPATWWPHISVAQHGRPFWASAEFNVNDQWAVKWLTEGGLLPAGYGLSHLMIDVDKLDDKQYHIGGRPLPHGHSARLCLALEEHPVRCLTSRSPELMKPEADRETLSLNTRGSAKLLRKLLHGAYQIPKGERSQTSLVVKT